jgi:LacI family transcriptional regulator
VAGVEKQLIQVCTTAVQVIGNVPSLANTLKRSMRTRNEVTIHDIAKALDLSTATISRALNGSPVVSEETRTKIAHVANELGYQRNYFASRLRSQKSHVLGGMVTHLNTAIASCVLSGAESTASQMGYGVIFRQSMNKPEFRIHNVDNLKKYRVDGVLVTSMYHQECEALDHLSALDIPVVVVEASSLLPGRPKKKVSEFQDAYELTNYLIEKGCQRIACMSVDLSGAHYSALISGYCKALEAGKLGEGDKFILNTNGAHDSWSSICELMASMSTRPDGIIFASHAITALIFVPPGTSGTREEFWITWRKGSSSSQNHDFVEIGKLAATILISASERKNKSG